MIFNIGPRALLSWLRLAFWPVCHSIQILWRLSQGWFANGAPALWLHSSCCHFIVTLSLEVTTALLWRVLSTSCNFIIDFLLRPSNYFVYFGSDMVYLILPVKSGSDLVICRNEGFQFLLELVILVIQVAHMWIKSVNFSLQINLVPHHLVRMILDAVELVHHRFFVLFTLVVMYGELLNLQLVFFTSHIFKLIGLDKLLLGVGMLMILCLKITKFIIQIV